ADDVAVGTLLFLVPSLEADQWGVIDGSGTVGMRMPPLPDDSILVLQELRQSSYGVSWDPWEPVDPLARTPMLKRYRQFRVDFERSAAPYRPALRTVKIVVTG